MSSPQRRGRNLACHRPSKGVISQPKGRRRRSSTSWFPPGPNDVIVKIAACGCTHDPRLPRRRHNDEYPVPPRPRAAGIVETVELGRHACQGRRLRHPQLAGRVRTVPGLRRGRPWYRFDTFSASEDDDVDRRHQAGARHSGSARSSKTLIPRGQCKGQPGDRPSRRRSAGCGVMAGLGAAMNTGNVGRGAIRSPSSAAAWAIPRSPAPSWRGHHDHRHRPHPASSAGVELGATSPPSTTPRSMMAWSRPCRADRRQRRRRRQSTPWVVRRRTSRRSTNPRPGRHPSCWWVPTTPE